MIIQLNKSGTLNFKFCDLGGIYLLKNFLTYFYSLVIIVSSEKCTYKIVFHRRLLDKILRLISLYSIITFLFLSCPLVIIVTEYCSTALRVVLRK